MLAWWSPSALALRFSSRNSVEDAYDGASDVGLHHRLIAKPHDHGLFVPAEPVSQSARRSGTRHHQTTAVAVHLQPHRASLVPPDPADAIRDAQLPGSAQRIPTPSQVRSNNARRINNG